MLKEDRTGSFPITIRFKRTEDPLYHEILHAPDPRKFIKDRLLEQTPLKSTEPLERIAASLEEIVSLLKNEQISFQNKAPEPSQISQIDEEPKLLKQETELSKRFSSILNSTNWNNP